MNIKRFKIKIPQSQIDDLHERLRKTIWPSVIPGQNYGGPELARMKELTKKALRFNWRKKESELNKLRRDVNGDGFLNLSDSENLVLIPADGGEERLLNLRGRAVFSPSWSPDGRYLLVLVLDGEGQNAIWRFDTQTENFVRITEPGPYFHPRYSNPP